jgi:hypothetical protein
MEFEGFHKIPRLNRNMVVTEKIDGTNAAIVIEPLEHEGDYDESTVTAVTQDWTTKKWVAIYCQSRKRIIKPGDDNFGFAAWVSANAVELTKLGEGRHFGEWWGGGIQRGYGLQGGGEPDRRFSLFNVKRWSDGACEAHGYERPACVEVVPVLEEYAFDQNRIATVLNTLREGGSRAAPGFMDPEGIVVYHVAARQMFKVTLEDDAKPKGAQGQGNVVVNSHAPTGSLISPHAIGGGQPSAAPLEAYA